MCNHALEFLTDGYQPIAQMSLAIADMLGYLQPDYAIVNPIGDSSSAELPYFISPVRTAEGVYLFEDFTAEHLVAVSPAFQIIVYQLPEWMA